MYGFSDQPNGIPLTPFNALRQGSSRYSATMAFMIERMFCFVQPQAQSRKDLGPSRRRRLTVNPESVWNRAVDAPVRPS